MKKTDQVFTAEQAFRLAGIPVKRPLNSYPIEWGDRVELVTNGNTQAWVEKALHYTHPPKSRGVYRLVDIDPRALKKAA